MLHYAILYLLLTLYSEIYPTFFINAPVPMCAAFAHKWETVSVLLSTHVGFAYTFLCVCVGGTLV